jgi:hypothetical protein
MSYMRGHFCLWSDGERLHLWAVDGYDGWDDSIWAEGVRSDRETAGERTSGVALPMDVVDELVVMRLAEIIDEKRLVDAIDRPSHATVATAAASLLLRRRPISRPRCKSC